MLTQIKPDSSSALIDWDLLYRYRDLLWLWVRRDMVAKYRQTLLGPLWFVFQPLVTALIFLLVFSKGLNVSTDGVPPVLFYLSGLLVWTYVSQTLNSTSMTLIANSGLFKKVFFPRLILPFSYSLSSLVSVALQMGIILTIYCGLIMSGAQVRPGPMIGLFPLFLLQMIFLSFGLGLWISALSVRYRDFHHLWSLLSPLWLYVTPVSYPLSAIPYQWRWLIELNPLTTIIEGMRLGLLQVGTLSFTAWSVSFAETLLIVFSGIVLFQKVERNCVDSI
ncbi:MAG: ABC transporter permease [Proteobacteria bacterium]|nr:ABC transporter permease [Pseudomonadota bacterium]